MYFRRKGEKTGLSLLLANRRTVLVMATCFALANEISMNMPSRLAIFNLFHLMAHIN